MAVAASGHHDRIDARDASDGAVATPGGLSEAQIAALEAQHGGDEGAIAAPPSKSPKERRKSQRSKAPRPGVVDYLVLSVLIVGGVWLGWHSVKIARADFQMMEARAEVHAWFKGAPWNLENWSAAQSQLLAARATLPTDPVIHDLLGMLWTLRARDAWRNPVAQAFLYKQAAAHQRDSLALRPRHGWAWASLAESLAATSVAQPETWDAWRAAQRYTPYEPTVQLTLLYVAIGGWRAAPNDVRLAVKSLYETSPASVQAAADRSAAYYKVAFR